MIRTQVGTYSRSENGCCAWDALHDTTPIVCQKIMYHEMKQRLQKYASIIPMENSCIRLNSNRVNSLQMYDIAQNYRILHKVVLCLF
jgi:hypothetical protein